MAHLIFLVGVFSAGEEAVPLFKLATFSLPMDEGEPFLFLRVASILKMASNSSSWSVGRGARGFLATEVTGVFLE